MNKRKVAAELIKVAESLIAIDFPTDEAMKKYLKEHPDADKRNHRVVKTKSAPQKSLPAQHKTIEIDKRQKGKLAKGLAKQLEGEGWKGNRGSMAEEALKNIFENTYEYGDEDQDYKGKIIKEGDAFLGAISCRNRWDESEEKSYVKINALGTKAGTKGIGKRLIAEAIRSYVEKGDKLELRSDEGSNSFYEHIGMHKDEEHDNSDLGTIDSPSLTRYIWSYDEAKAFADKTLGTTV